MGLGATADLRCCLAATPDQTQNDGICSNIMGWVTGKLARCGESTAAKWGGNERPRDTQMAGIRRDRGGIDGRFIYIQPAGSNTHNVG